MPVNPRFVDDYLSYLLGRASHAVYKEFHSEVKAAGLSSLEWRVLATLVNGHRYAIGDLAHDLLAKQPTLTKLIQRMEEKGWVRSGEDEVDARRTLVYETSKGHAVAVRLIRSARSHEKRVLAQFKPQEIALFKSVLKKLFIPSSSLFQTKS